MVSVSKYSVSSFIAASLVALLFPVYSSVAATPDNKALFIDAENKLITNTKQMTFVGPRSGEGYFSADGKKMIFQSEREPNNPFYQMYITDLKSGQTDRISTGVGQTTCGWIHPNMKTAMWSSTHLDPETKDKVKAEFEKRNNPVKAKYSWGFDENYSIFTSDLNGKNLKQLTKTKGYNAEGSYSPDGKYIAFASNRDAYNRNLSDDEKKLLKRDASYFMEIYIMDADGKNVRQLTTSAGYDGGPFFSADGKKITWRRFTPDGSKAEIYTMNIDGTDQKQITQLGSMSWAPFFHPSGDYIIFGTAVLGFANFELFIVDSAGLQKPVRVTFSEGFDGLASFSPDGKTLTWSHRNEKGESQIYLADWDDQLARELLKITPRKQTESLSNLSSEVLESDAKSIVQYLAAPEFLGRATGSPEELIYTQKIADLFKSWGLKPAVGKNFIQTFEFASGIKAGKDNSASLKGRFEKDLKLGTDYQVLSYSSTGKFQPAPLAFAGFGIKAPASSEMAAYDSYKDLDVKGKWVVVFDETPKPSQREFKKHTHILSFSRLQHKITVAKNLGATGFVIVQEGKISDLKFEGRLSDSQIPVIQISSSIFSELLTQNQDLAPELRILKSLRQKFETYENISGFQMPSQYLSANIELEFIKSTGHNVVAVLEPKIKSNQKALLIGAHGDHLGLGISGSSLAKGNQKGLAHLGADDNASGVSGVLEMAHAYSQDKNLKKPIVFAVWSGEEIGVLGSSYFVKNWKLQGFRKKDFDKTFETGLNMDMIGRLRESLQVQGTGSAKEWTVLAEKIAPTLPISLALTNDPYLPTDSMSIYLGQIPSISFFTGAHTEYHTPLDTPETLNYPGLLSSILTVKKFADLIVHSDKQQLSYQKVEGNSGQKLEGRSFRIFLGTIPDYSQEGVKGVRISGSAKDSPAEKAGLKANDVITEFDQTKIENIYDYVYTLQSVKPNIKTKIKILRGNSSLELDITPLLKE
jgi:Tol biopolymer transport system component